MPGWLRLAACLLLVATTAFAKFDAPRARHRLDVPYDGRITFVRLGRQSGARFARGSWASAWGHDFPRAEENVSRIVRELSYNLGINYMIYALTH